jgi:hypothetical protein
MEVRAIRPRKVVNAIADSSALELASLLVELECQGSSRPRHRDAMVSERTVQLTRPFKSAQDNIATPVAAENSFRGRHPGHSMRSDSHGANYKGCVAMSELIRVLEESERLSLQAVREIERVRVEAIRRNDTDAMHEIIDPKFVYVNANGTMYDRDSYIAAVRSHRLTYSSDLELTETDHRVDDDVVILVGMMRGHARLDGEQQVYQVRNMRVWRARAGGWKLLAWQSSTLWNSPIGIR